VASPARDRTDAAKVNRLTRMEERSMSIAHDKYAALQARRNATPLALDPRTTALVIIDMQEYFLNPASPFSRASESIVPGVLGHFQERGRGVVEPSLRRLLDHFRAHGLRIVYTTVASELPDGSDLMPIFRQRNAASRAAGGDAAIPARTDAWARIVAALEPRPGELVVNKTTYGTFNSTGLDHALRSLGIVSLVIGGVVTNVCVETTARDAADRGYDVVLLDDGCAAFSPEIHEATLLSFQGPFGRVRKTDEVLALLEPKVRRH
jgi:nicotinamidase-related amidase